MLVCTRSFSYNDHYRGRCEAIADVTRIREGSELALLYPGHFAPASERDTQLRSGDSFGVNFGREAARVTGSRASTTSPAPATVTKPKPPRQPFVHYDQHRQRWVQESPPARKTVARQPAARGPRRESAPATPAPSDKPWSLGPTPEPEPSPPACQRRYEPDISTELRGPAQGSLRGILGRTTAVNDCEVGGLLVGHRTASRFIVFRATQSAGVGSRSGFVYDLETDLKVAGELCEREGFEILGAWHSHSEHVPYPFPPVVDLLSEPDLCSAASWRSELDAPAAFVLMVCDQASRWICLPSVVQASDHAGPDVISPSRLVF